jgi:hypothetical protein
MENKIYYTVEIVPDFNRNIVERDKMDAPNTQKHGRSLFVSDHQPKFEYILVRVHAMLYYYLFITLESCELVVVMLTYLS